jgi:Arm DNA-binding domain
MASKLTDIAIRNAKPRTKKFKISAGQGLTLLVMPNGSRYWRLRYWFAGKEKDLSVGRPYPELSLKDAQEEAMRLRVLIAEGTDPAEQRFQTKLDRTQRAANTFGEAAEAWFEFRAKAWAKRTAAQVREYLDKD